MNPDTRIYVAGHRGMVGSAVVRALQAKGYNNLVTRSHDVLDLTDQSAVRAFFQSEKIDQVYLAAARVGGINANKTYPAEFIYQNLMIQTNVIHEAWKSGVQKLLFLGSSCIYPRDCPQPIKEEYLLNGHLEPTNEPYAIAKIAGIKQCESYNRQYGCDYRCVMPSNLYGPGDNYDLANSHVLPALIRKFHLAKLAQQNDIPGIIADEARYGAIPADIKEMIGLSPNAPIRTNSVISPKISITLWGTGKPYREFLHVDDMATASVFIMEQERKNLSANTVPLSSSINIGYGSDLTIREAAGMVAEIVGYCGEFVFDEFNPDGPPKKLMDNWRITQLGWKPHVPLWLGLEQAYAAYRSP